VTARSLPEIVTESSLCSMVRVEAGQVRSAWPAVHRGEILPMNGLA
jgi:hypothetical protein